MLLQPVVLIALTFGFTKLSYVNRTSSEVNGWPSCQVTPWRRWNVYVNASGETVQEVASLGTRVPVLSMVAIGSSIALTTS